MVSKTCSIKRGVRRLECLLLLVGLLALSACSLIQPRPETAPDMGLPSPEIVGTDDQLEQTPDSRMLASHSLTLTGYQLLQAKDYDGAIRTLERAVGINPADGPGYFYLAEAWLAKNNFNLATQFNGLASLYLRHDPTWSERARIQKKRIGRAVKGM